MARNTNILPPAALALMGMISAIDLLSATAEIAKSADAPGGGLQIVGDRLYLAAWGHGFHVLDISNPTHPQWLGGWNNHTSPTGVYVAGNHAYLANRTSGLDVIDVREPQSAAHVGHLFTGGDAWSVYAAGKFAYLADTLKGLEVIDINNPAKPALAGRAEVPDQAVCAQVAEGFLYATYNSKGLRVFKLEEAAPPAKISESAIRLGAGRIQVVDHQVYYANGGEFQIIDVTDPHAPVVQSSCRIDGGDNRLHVSGGYAYIASSWGDLQVLDVSDSQKPRVVGVFKAGYNVWDVRVAGPYAYLMDRGANLHVIDVSIPGSPKEVGGLGTCDFCSDVLSLAGAGAERPGLRTGTTASGAITNAPPELAAAMIEGGAFTFTLRGIPNDVYYLQASGDLIAWTAISTNTLPSDGTLRVSDPQAHLFDNRFYRAVRKP